ncbi:hypothetical protein C8A01DRAFT_36374 [Parachaetomium inaequale]|uniref:Uncharacterized protein n=1 Tax=Parachaetomium inaequale TaxID=2588326 RepID=A0AAN6PJH8_9PEZI|nr:hypothetical protein C8A01DRAFT_36374 [Parachaetomium inaequale]
MPRNPVPLPAPRPSSKRDGHTTSGNTKNDDPKKRWPSNREALKGIDQTDIDQWKKDKKACWRCFVFFSRNRFIIHDFHAEQPWDLPAEQLKPDSPETASTSTSYPFERLAISEFLREVVPIHCLTYLRFLELVFPPYVPHGWPHREHPAILDWVATVDWVRGQVNAPALTLRLVMADFGAGPITGRKVMTQALAGDISRGYACIMHPLRPLVKGDGGGLAGFYLQLAHPARWTLDVVRRAQLDDGFLARLHRNIIVWAERCLRGPGSSTLDHLNRAEPSKSSWQRWYQVDSHGD